MQRLVAGEISVREAIDQPWCWCIDIDPQGSVIQTWATSLHQIPQNVLPKEDAYLALDLEPIFSVKVEGHKLTRYNVPASVVKRAVDGAYTALKKLSESVGGGGMGRPSEVSRKLFDFPTKHVALGSFQISFGGPIVDGVGQEDIDARSQMETRGQELGKALNWATGKSLENVFDIALLEAMQKLAPPTQGLIETVSVGGSMLGSPRSLYVLNRSASRKVHQALSAARRNLEQIVTLRGEARELDKDRLSFRLKAEGTNDDYTCIFDEEIYDDVMEAFSSDQLIQIALRQSSGARQGQVIAVSAISDTSGLLQSTTDGH